MNVNSKKIIHGKLDRIISRVTEALQSQGFGVLTRIDFHSKIKEKVGHDIKPVIILGACRPDLAYEAYQANTDVTSLMPCNVVMRELEDGRYSIEFASAETMLSVIPNDRLHEVGIQVDQMLQAVNQSIPETIP